MNDGTFPNGCNGWLFDPTPNINFDGHWYNLAKGTPLMNAAFSHIHRVLTSSLVSGQIG